MTSLDPQGGEGRHEERAANSFEALAREWLTKQGPTWAEFNRERVVRLFERDLYPWLGGLPISGITPPMMLSALRRIEERGAATRPTAPSAARPR